MTTRRAAEQAALQRLLEWDDRHGCEFGSSSTTMALHNAALALRSLPADAPDLLDGRCAALNGDSVSGALRRQNEEEGRE
jgi:hypothetical protein